MRSARRSVRRRRWPARRRDRVWVLPWRSYATSFRIRTLGRALTSKIYNANRTNLTDREAATAWGHDRLNTRDRQQAASFLPQPPAETVSARPTRDVGTAALDYRVRNKCDAFSFGPGAANCSLSFETSLSASCSQLRRSAAYDSVCCVADALGNWIRREGTRYTEALSSFAYF